MTTSLKALEKAPCIQYSIQFQSKFVNTLVNSGSKINTITPDFAIKLELIPRQTNISVEKINNTHLYIYDIIIVGFSL